MFDPVRVVVFCCRDPRVSPVAIQIGPLFEVPPDFTRG